MKFIALLTLCIAISTLVQAKQITLDAYDANYKMSYEKISISDREDMGLLGVSMLFDHHTNWYTGMTLYGAVDGHRGGFFTLGLDNGYHFNVTQKIALESGVYVGAGGGGGAPQGGGLMIRPYIGGSYLFDHFTFGVGASYIDFPNGDIQSSQIYAFIKVPMQGLYLKGHNHDVPELYAIGKELWPNKKLKISFLTEHYTPSSDSLNTDGATKTEPFSLAGIQIDSYLDDRWYTYVQTAGAGRGKSDGYMEVFGGVGYEYPLAGLPIYIDVKGALGASGGGKVNTGGGWVYHLKSGIKTKLSHHLSLSLNGGIIESIGGNFSASSYSLNLGYSTMLINDFTKEQHTDLLLPSVWNMSMIHKSYVKNETFFKDSAREGKVELLGFGLDYFMSEHFYLTGQTFWAYDGGAGGYAEGIVGAGYHSNDYHQFSVYTEILAGVGGGGGVNIGGGLFGSLGTGIIYETDSAWEADIGAALVRTSASAFSSYQITFGINYKFSFLGKQ